MDRNELEKKIIKRQISFTISLCLAFMCISTILDYFTIGNEFTNSFVFNPILVIFIGWVGCFVIAFKVEKKFNNDGQNKKL